MTTLLSPPDGVDRARVEMVIAEEIRPLLRVHGGDVVLLAVENGDLELEFVGSCRACALKSVTYAIGIRERLIHLSGVRSVKVAGINLSEVAINRVAQAYSSHPLLKSMRRAKNSGTRPGDAGACSHQAP